MGTYAVMLYYEMVWSMPYTIPCHQIVKMICERLIRPSSYAAVKIAGLYLLSDILHNAAAPVKHASNYRALVQAQLPTVVESIAEIYRKTNSRMASHNVRLN